MKSNIRTVVWFSCGAASAVAAKLSANEKNLHIVYCETGAEHPDNRRFLRDCEIWVGRKIERVASSEYEDTWDVWKRRRYLAGVSGAPCTVELKVKPRLIWQKPTDIHIFGYTADKGDLLRADRLAANYPELHLKMPLIELSITKSACLAILQQSGIKLPPMYGLGFQNNNCIPCAKATSPAYWALMRKNFPSKFARMARLSRRLDVKLCRINGKRKFIDQIPRDYPTTRPVQPACDFLCHQAKARP
jgi:3'-phosphoadenosine 5'-phosphosulfate sulfotransferase (PAPS reductase)/FAD synthetase